MEKGKIQAQMTHSAEKLDNEGNSLMRDGSMAVRRSSLFKLNEQHYLFSIYIDSWL